MAARSSGPPPAASQPAAWPPRLLLNTDGNWINNYQERREPADITRLAGPLRAAGVDMLCALIGIDDDLSWRGSPHGQLWCDNVTEWNVDGVPTDIHGHPIREGGGVHIHGRPAANQQATNAHQELYNTIVSVIEDGHDLLQVYIDGARAHGMGVVGSMRMNDAHTDSEDRMWYGRSALKIERPDLLIGPDLPEAVHGIPWTFSWLWDYARDEVRERFLGIMDDALTRYDFDGLELDFSRAPPFFKGGQAVRNIPTMTGFVRQARAIVGRHSKERGRELRLIVRVPTSIGESLLIGLDTLEWIREGLADIVVLSSPGYCITRADVAEAAAAAGNGPVLIYRGFDGATYGASPQEGYERNPPAVLRGAALNGYREGVQGIAVFNYDYGSHRAGPVPGDYHDLTEDHLRVLTELRDPDALARRDRCYYLAGPPQPGPAADHRPVLPRRLALRGRGAGAGHALTITVRDDLHEGLAAGRIRSTELRLRLGDHEGSTERMHLAVNGRRIPFTPDRTLTNSRGDEWLVFDDPGLQEGSNSVLLILEGASTPRPWPSLLDCEIVVSCGGAS